MARDIETVPGAMESLKAALCEIVMGREARFRRNEAGGAAEESGPAGRHSDVLRLHPRQWRRIGRDIMALHQGYTTGRAAFAHGQNPIHGRLSAYQLYFMPRNIYRVRSVIAELPWVDDIPSALPDAWADRDGAIRTLRLLDLGCGTGAFSLAWLDWLSRRLPPPASQWRIEVTLVDQGRELISVAEGNLRGFAARALPGVGLRIDFRADGVERFLTGESTAQPYAVVGAAMLLGELGLLGPRRTSKRAQRVSEGLRRLTRPGGCVLFVEPGTRKGYMNLMAVRERLRGLPIVYPCPHGAPCPLWSKQVRNWCHATRPLPPAFFFDDLLRRHAGLDFEMRHINLAGLAFQVSDYGRVFSPFRAREGERIVSSALPAREGPRAAPGAPVPAKVVLACAPDGHLHERPAATIGPYPRGRWRDSQRAERER